MNHISLSITEILSYTHKLGNFEVSSSLIQASMWGQKNSIKQSQRFPEFHNQFEPEIFEIFSFKLKTLLLYITEYKNATW